MSAPFLGAKWRVYPPGHRDRFSVSIKQLYGVRIVLKPRIGKFCVMALDPSFGWRVIVREVGRFDDLFSAISCALRQGP